MSFPCFLFEIHCCRHGRAIAAKVTEFFLPRQSAYGGPEKIFFLSHFCFRFALISRSASIPMWRLCKVQSDAELVNAVLNGDKEAFAMLVKRYERPVRAAALDVLGDYHSATDVSQDAFVTAYENLSGLRKPLAFGPWLMKITRRCALDYVRRRQKEAPQRPAVAAAIVNPDGRLVPVPERNDL
jgi:hypothetical protein